MKKELLQEGAVAGHMNHIYDNGEMTFGELKQLLQTAVDGKLRGTEKTDGQNVYLSFDVSRQKARAIRNKTHILAGGLDVEQFDEFFSTHPNQALRYSFVEALQAFEDIVRELDKDTQLKIFGTKEDNIYFNTEVMNPGTPGLGEDDPRSKGTTNVIPYDKKTLLIHAVGHDKFHPKTALSLTAKHLGEDAVDLSRNYELLERSLIGKGTDEASVFSVETHPQRKLEPAGQKRAAAVLESSLESINNLVRDFGLDDSNTIQDLVMVQITPIIDAFGLTEDRNKLLVQRLMRLCRSLKDKTQYVPCGLKDPVTKKPLHEPRPTMRDITSGIPQDLKDEIKEFDNNFRYQNYTAALSNSLYDFTNAILQDFHSAFISDNEAIIKKLQNEIELSMDKIRNSSNEAAKEDLEKQFAKLKDVKNINTPSEGFVFDFNGTTYKFTGWFAPSNQILGTERYGRFGPIEPSEGAETSVETGSESLTIALFPGSFKPPHKGHVLAATALAEEADVIYILVSAPQLSGRALKSGGPITAEQAIQCWNAFIDKSPLKNKAKIMVGPQGVASPMMTAIDFIQHPADPNNMYAAPLNATVILGVGAKGNDADRYGAKVMQKSKENRPDLTIRKMAVGPFEHSGEYLSLLKQHPSVANILNKGKGRVSPDELSEEERLEGKSADKQLYHASDMRDFIDLAMEDPIGLEFLKDFVPLPEDVLALMGILGLNAADAHTSEEDQVLEPEVDKLEEIITQEARRFLEGFKVQQAPAGRPSKDPFLVGMRAKLKTAHQRLLDGGRKDLTRFGGAFTQARPKNVSNAYLAEDEELEEMSSVAGGAGGGHVSGAFTNFKRDDNKMTKQEKKLRMKIQRGLKEFFIKNSSEHRNNISSILEEHALRVNLRNIILEQSAIYEVEDPTTDIHDSTGINTLKDLLKNTNVLATLREVYKTLTTSEDQRKSFRAHVIKWVQDTLAPVKLNDTSSLESEDLQEQEDVGVDVLGVGDGDENKFIDASDGSEKEKKPEEDEEGALATISGEDTTGRNKAERIYPNIEKSIVDYYAELDNPEDQEMFYDYLIANLKLYFDKWSSEMAVSVDEPTNDAYMQAAAGANGAEVESPSDESGISL
jgi:hypothetical protein